MERLDRTETNSPKAGGEASLNEVDLVTSQKMDRRMLLKTDAVILVQLVAIATLEFLDKNSLAYSAILGLRTDTNLVGQQYSWLGSIFYFGYLSALPLSAFLVTRMRVGQLVGISTAGWGVCLMCMAACHNFGGLATVRFFLGVFEASILPCFMNLSAAWYKRSEQPLRTAFWYNTFAGIFGGICAYGIATRDAPLESWKIMFLIYGSITVVIGTLSTFLLPDKPARAWFLNATEKVQAEVRLKENQQVSESTNFSFAQCLEALLSPEYWTLVIFAIAQSITNAGVTNFNPLVISGFGFSAQRTTLLATPQAAVAFIAQSTLSILVLYLPNIRCLIWVFSCLPALAGALMIHLVDHTTQRGTALAGVYLMGFYNVSWVMALALATANTSGKTKKAFVSSSMAVAYAVGNIVGPQFFRSDQSPTYKLGIFAMLVCYIIMACCGIAYWGIVLWLNKSRASAQAKTSTPEGHSVAMNDQGKLDMTDRENVNFVYAY
ncbi:hypothetical protein PFICI_13993 [Pestalotiopsis fici W106-1]|uniref:Major facilitator superfamily (MFS) profile domain-containing protein n=1 Tax=Pestalotiopsis fici (strain W106-1 / CGMCC3.15140) TaxID=1229662 RepID=W3WLS0_PESFW|nr:uncharacterized protein PFICI_13993 [Pestalotiopsis fici W106-1]ETS74127.1 hypothetical protein PFICI_13993 [Pestalotiopsis fici W106-1]